MAKFRCPTIAVSRISTTYRTPSSGTGRLEPNSDQAGRAPRSRLLEARLPGVDIIAGASLARRRVNLPFSIVKIRSGYRTGFSVAGFRGGLEKMLPNGGAEGSQ